TSVVMTVLWYIGNEHGHPGHIGRVAAWCWTKTGRTGKATIGNVYDVAFLQFLAALLESVPLTEIVPFNKLICGADWYRHYYGLQKKKTKEQVDFAVHFFTFYAPLWGTILFNGIVYFQVIGMLNNVTRWTKSDLVGAVNRCNLFMNDSEDHGHLFFKCLFSKNIWEKIQNMTGLVGMAPDWVNIMQEMASKPNGYNIWSVVRRGAAGYPIDNLHEENVANARELHNIEA
ncbi:G-protein coupled receptor 1, partial [Tanacetum coccineum]